MNILYASLCYPPSIGGGEIHLHCIAHELARQGHGVHVINQWSRTRSDWLYGATLRCDPPKTYDYEGIEVRQLGFDSATRRRMWPWVLAYRQKPLRGMAIRKIAALMQKDFDAAADAGGSADLIHGVRIGCEFLLTAALERARRLDIPFVITALHHPNWTQSKHKHYAHLYREADAVIALTQFEKRLLVEQKGVREERVHVTGIGPVLAPEYSVESFRARHNIKGRYVLYVGRKVNYKGWAEMVAASPRVFARHPDVEFVFIGGDTPESKALFGAQTDARIRNLGTVDLADKTAALAGCELLCMPSGSESFGGVFTEGWAMGKPVIGLDTAPIDEVIDAGVDGLLIPPEPAVVVDALGEAIDGLLDRPQDAQRMGEAGRQKVERRYSWERLAGLTLNTYEAALRGRAAATSSMRAAR